MRNSESLDYSDLPERFTEDIKKEYFAKATKKCKTLIILMVKEAGNLGGHDCPNSQKFFHFKADGEMWKSSSYPFIHKITVNCAKLRAEMFSNGTIKNFKK